MWPDGARCAAAFTFDFDAEEVWIGEDPENAGHPGVLSQGTYGAKVAVPLILDLLARHGVQATFYIPGRVAERHPERVAAIAAAGHEIAHHGYTHTSPHRLSRARGGDRAGPRPGDPARLRGRGDRLPGAVLGPEPAHPGPAAPVRPELLLEPDGRHPALQDRQSAAGRGADLLDPGRRPALLVRRRELDQDRVHDRARADPVAGGVPGHPGAGRGQRVHDAPADHRPPVAAGVPGLVPVASSPATTTSG